MSGEREGMRFLTTRCPGWGAVLPPTLGALGYCWGWAGGGGQLSPFPTSPGITYRKKTGEGKLEMFTKHTSHSTVNPLDAKQTHQEPALGRRLPQHHRPASRGFFGLVLLDTIPAASIRAHLPGACFPGGVFCFLPPPRLFLLGWELWEAPVSARGGSGSVGDAGAHSLPSQMHFKAKLPFFFLLWGWQRAGRGCSRGPRGCRTFHKAVQAPVPWHFPGGEALWKSWECPRCHEVHPLGIRGSHLHASSSGSSPGCPGEHLQLSHGSIPGSPGEPRLFNLLLIGL